RAGRDIRPPPAPPSRPVSLRIERGRVHCSRARTPVVRSRVLVLDAYGPRQFRCDPVTNGGAPPFRRPCQAIWLANECKSLTVVRRTVERGRPRFLREGDPRRWRGLQGNG